MPDDNYKQLHDERLENINSGKTTYLLPNSLRLSSFEEIVEMQLGCNKCFTLFDLQKGEFIKWHLVKEVFGYTNDEFSIQAINNFGNPYNLKITHVDDIEHKLRYDRIIYSIIGNEKEFGIRMDSYCLNMRIYHKHNNRVLPIRRKSFIFEANDRIPFIQLDEWELNNRYKTNHVFPELIIWNNELREKITEKFYRQNLEQLQIGFTDVALKVLHYKIKGESNASISEKIGINEQSIANTHYRNFEKLRSTFPREIDEIVVSTAKINKKKKRIDNINVFREICRKYGFYPVPDTILGL